MSEAKSNQPPALTLEEIQTIKNNAQVQLDDMLDPNSERARDIQTILTGMEFLLNLLNPSQTPGK